MPGPLAVHCTVTMRDAAAKPGLTDAPTEVVELVVNLDDLSPEVVGQAQEALLAAGALDVWTTPISMKKQRPGVMLSLLCEARQREAMALRVLELTGSFGVRYRAWNRLVLDRRHETLSTRFGAVRAKVGSLAGRVYTVRPEYEDVRCLAAQQGASLREVMQAAEAAAERWRHQQGAGRD